MRRWVEWMGRSRGRSRLVAVLLCMTISAACAEERAPDRAGAVEVTDSAGVRIVSLPELAAESTWTVESVWRLESVQGEVLNGLRGARFLSDGRIALSEADGVVARIRVLQPDDGALIQTIGRRGEGPGEFLSPRPPVPTPRGGLWVADTRTRRITRIGPDGEIEGTRETPDVGVIGLPELHLSPEANYLWVSSNLGSAIEGEPLRRDNGVLSVLDDDGVREVTAFPGVQYMANGSIMGGPPWGARSLFAGSGSGVWLGDIARPEIDHYDEAGLRMRVRWSAQPTPVGEDERTAFLEQMREMAPPGAWEQVEPNLRALLVIETKPYWYQLAPGDQGRVWVGTAERMGLPTEVEGAPPETEWVILDADGRPVAEVTTPDGFTLYDVRGDLAMGVHMDELGVERLELLRITR